MKLSIIPLNQRDEVTKDRSLGIINLCQHIFAYIVKEVFLAKTTIRESFVRTSVIFHSKQLRGCGRIVQLVRKSFIRKQQGLVEFVKFFVQGNVFLSLYEELVTKRRKFVELVRKAIGLIHHLEQKHRNIVHKNVFTNETKEKKEKIEARTMYAFS